MLYLKEGIPIYPPCNGHACNTIFWRMKVEEGANDKNTSASVHNANTAQQDGSDDEDRFDRERSLNRERNRLHRNPHNIMNNFAEWALFMDRTSSTNPLDSSNSNVTAVTTYLEEKAHWYYSQPSFNRGVSTASPQQQQHSSPNQREVRAGSTFNASPPSSSSPLTTATTPEVSLLCHLHLIQEHIKRKPSAISLLDRDIANADHTNTVLTDILDDIPVDNNLNNNILEASRSADTMQNVFPRVVSLSADFFNRADEVAVSRWIAQQRQTPTSPTASAGQQPSPLLDDSVSLQQQQQEVTSNNSSMLLHPSPHARLDSSLRIQRSRSASFSAAVSAASTTTTTIPLHKMRIVPYSSNRGIPKKMQLIIDKYWQRISQAATDGADFASILFEFWDEIFPHSKTIAFHDGHTPVPRLDTLETFLTAPCPRHIGIVQCEIERVKVGGKKNVKGRFFPTYEYNLFIRDNGQVHNGTIMEQPSQRLQHSSTAIDRQHVLLMRAKNYGRSCCYSNTDHYYRATEETPSTCTSSTTAEVLQRRTEKSRPIKLKKKRGVSNYFLCMELHSSSATCPLPATVAKSPEPKLTELGRLQSNLLGTEFQIFSPRKSKAQFCNNRERFDSTGTAWTPTEHVQTTPSEANISRTGRGWNSSTSERSPSLGYSWPLLKISSRRNRRAIAQDELPSPYQHNPETMGNTDESLSHLGREIESGIITYTANLLGNRPRIMEVCIPKPQSMVDGECCDDGSDYLLRSQWETHCQRVIHEGQCESIEGENLMLTRFRQLQERLNLRVDDNENFQGEPSVDEDGDDFGLLVLHNRPPWWNEDLGAFVLNFGGRVSIASVKNFQLCHRNDRDHVMLQFGRIQGRHGFTMDFQYPLTAVQAFAIAVSSLQSKISLG